MNQGMLILPEIFQPTPVRKLEYILNQAILSNGLL